MKHLLEVGAMSKTTTAYDKDYDLTIDGVEYRVILHWDDVNGFESTWLDSENRFTTSPDWVWEDDEFCLKLDGYEPHTKHEHEEEQS